MKLDNKRVLVTGSNGMFGKFLIKELKKYNCQIIPFSKSGGDITDFDSLSKVGKVDIICHLAAIPSVAYSFKNPYEVFKVNSFGTLNVLEFAKQQKVEKFIFISSYLYGNPNSLPINEKHPLQLGNPYAESKLIAEKYCKNYQELFNFPILVLRPFNVYGPDQKNALIPTIKEQIKNNEIILQDLEPKRDYVYIDDVISVIISALKSDIKGYEIFNVGFGKSYSVKELLDIIFNLIKKEIPVKNLNQRRQNEIMDCVADITKAKKLLHWEPKISLEEGLSKIFL